MLVSILILHIGSPLVAKKPSIDSRIFTDIYSLKNLIVAIL